MARFLLAFGAFVAVSSFAAGGDAAPVPPEGPPLTVEQLPPAPLPGKIVHGRFRGPGLGRFREANRLISTGRGYRRTALLAARGPGGQLCLGATAGSTRGASFRCLARWDHPPFIARMGIGGKRRDRIGWIATVGVARVGTVVRVTAETQRGDLVNPKLQAWPGFPWTAFAVFTRHGNLATELRPHNAAGNALQRIDLGYAYDSPCPDYGLVAPVSRPKTKAICKGGAKLNRWTAVRDPVAERQAPTINGPYGTRAKRLAFDHPAVRRFVAGQSFAIDGVALWTNCDQRRLGAVVDVVLTTPVDFEADLPVIGGDGRTKTAYEEAIAHMRARNMGTFWVKVDLNRSRVVAVNPEPDLHESGFPDLAIDEYRLVTPMRPAGGPNRRECPKSGD
jgi:hypothetical protein